MKPAQGQERPVGERPVLPEDRAPPKADFVSIPYGARCMLIVLSNEEYDHAGQRGLLFTNSPPCALE